MSSIAQQTPHTGLSLALRIRWIVALVAVFTIGVLYALPGIVLLFLSPTIYAGFYLAVGVVFLTLGVMAIKNEPFVSLLIAVVFFGLGVFVIWFVVMVTGSVILDLVVITVVYIAMALGLEPAMKKEHDARSQTAAHTVVPTGKRDLPHAA